MCGFAVLIARKDVKNQELLKAIERDLYHRGPDSGKILVERNWSLVFRRLSIIDPVRQSDQPMTDKTGRFTIVFNGEIYNYKELRTQLSNSGIIFQTNGDAEVLLYGFIEWGEKLFEKLEGMYAIAIMDRFAGKAYISRDPLGIKPLYRTVGGVGIAFSSEIRPLRRLVGTKLDIHALGELLSFRFAGGERSNLENIEKVLPGSLLVINLENGIIQERCQQNILNTIKPDKNFKEIDAINITEKALIESVKKHLQSDVGFTVQLSGGIDSGLIAAIAAQLNEKPIKSFAVKLSNPAFDEGNWRKEIVAKYGLNHEEVEISDIDFADELPKAIVSMEGPTAHFGCVMLKILCKQISKYGKVVLTGEGADEFFGGYDRYAKWRSLRQMGVLGSMVPKVAWPFLSRYEGYKRFAKKDPAIWASCYHNYLKMAELFPEIPFVEGARKKENIISSDFRSRMLASDQTVYLESLLLRQDKMAMASSVEARVPFCDYKLAKVLNSIPYNIRIPGNETKPLLKKIAQKYLPKNVVYRRKVGLNLPLDDWLENPRGFGRYLELLTSPDCRLAQFGNRKRILDVVSKFRKGNRVGIPSLPILINVELWLRSLDSEF